MGKMMCEWMLEQGGLAALEQLAIQRSNMLYNLIDDSNGFYNTFVTDPKLRSRMQVVFTIKSGEGKDSQVVHPFLKSFSVYNRFVAYSYPHIV